MTAATHLAFSYLLCSVAGVSQPAALGVSLVALVPDIDHPQSLVGRVFPFASRYLIRKYGHRTITHSLFAILAVALVASPLCYFSTAIYGAIVLAYASHIFIDLFNLSGVKFLTPFSQKEYISFRTPELRIMVKSWKEYLALFVIIVLAVTVTGQSFSLFRAVRAVSRVFYRHYDGALTDYQNNSERVCTAKIEYFDHVKTLKLTREFTVLNMFSEKIYLLSRDGDGPGAHRRVILKKADIIEIEIMPSGNRVNQTILAGSNISSLRDIAPGSYISGTITVKNYHPELRNTDHIKIDKTPSTTQITLTAALPHELKDIINIKRERNRELESLRSKTSVIQIARLQNEEASIKKRLSALSQRGFYENYRSIARLNGELKMIESRIETLRMRDASGADVDLGMKIDKLERDFGITYSLYLVAL